MATAAQVAWRNTFGQAARYCSKKVAHLPKGERAVAFRACMKAVLRR